MSGSGPWTGPLLVTFSGVDGAGKSTNIASLAACLAHAGFRVRIVTFWDNVVVLPRLREHATTAWFRGEKGVGAPGKPVRRRDKNLRPWYATLGRCALYLADTIHLRWFLKKMLNSQEEVILFDRYIYDQLATLPIEQRIVRGYARLLATLAPQPNIAYLLDTDPDTAFARKPEYPVAFLQTYRRSYLRLKELLGCLTLIEPLPIEETHRRIVFELERVLVQVGHIQHPA